MRARADLRAVRCVGFALTAVALLGSGSAFAATSINTITYNPNSPPPVGRTVQPEAIGYFDCLAKRPLDYDVSTTEAAGLVLDVLVNAPSGAGQTCTVTVGVDVDYNVCASALANPITAATDTLFVKLVSTDVVTALTTNPTTASTLDGGVATLCATTGVTALPQKITLTFVLLNGATVSAFKQMTLVYDLLGPPPPTAIKAGSGDQRLIVNWTAGSTTDLVEYRFYCDPPPPGTTSTASFSPAAAGTTGIDAGTGATLGTGGSLTTGGTGGLAGATTGGVGGTFGTDSGAGTGGTATGTGGSSTGGTGGSTTVALCSNTLVQGSVPITVDTTTGTWKELPNCGSVGSTNTSGEARPLNNGTEYAVAVAGVDALGNIGPLSNVACGTPKAVTDFFEAYRNAGGSGGGGFCAIAARPAPGAAALLVAAFAARRLRRRRRAARPKGGARNHKAS